MDQSAVGWFRLSSVPGTHGVACSEEGVFVGGVPLLKREYQSSGTDCWRLRALGELNIDLSKRFGLPVEFGKKMAGLSAAAHALEQGDFARAQLTILFLQIPEPPDLSKCSAPDIVERALQLQASGMLKANWDPDKHPRWPAGSPDGIGGEFSPAGSGPADASLIPAQITIPAPFEIPVPGVPDTPLPFEIVPPPLTIPNSNPREVPTNPFPDRPECVEEWAAAYKFREKLWRSGRLGSREKRGMGKTFSQCLMGQVSEDCGGNSSEA